MHRSARTSPRVAVPAIRTGLAALALAFTVCMLAGGSGRALATPTLNLSMTPTQPTIADGIWFTFGLTDLPGTNGYQRWLNTRESFFQFYIDDELSGGRSDYLGTFDANVCFYYDWDDPDRCMARTSRMLGPFKLGFGQHTARVTYRKSGIADISAEGLGPVEIAFYVVPSVSLGGGGKQEKGPRLDLPYVGPASLPTGDLLLIAQDGTATVVDIAALAKTQPGGATILSLPFGIEDGTKVSYPGDANNPGFEYIYQVPAPAAPFALALVTLFVASPRRRGAGVTRTRAW